MKLHARESTPTILHLSSAEIKLWHCQIPSAQDATVSQPNEIDWVVQSPTLLRSQTNVHRATGSEALNLLDRLAHVKKENPDPTGLFVGPWRKLIFALTIG